MRHPDPATCRFTGCDRPTLLHARRGPQTGVEVYVPEECSEHERFYDCPDDVHVHEGGNRPTCPDDGYWDECQGDCDHPTVPWYRVCDVGGDPRVREVAAVLVREGAPVEEALTAASSV